MNKAGPSRPKTFLSPPTSAFAQVRTLGWLGEGLAVDGADEGLRGLEVLDGCEMIRCELSPKEAMPLSCCVIERHALQHLGSPSL